MKTIQVFGLIVAVLLLAGMASAQQVVTIQDVVDYHDNFWDEDIGVWFLVPREVFEEPENWAEDHWPWHRGSNQDWGWTHDLSGQVPLDATGIESATLTILGWDVNSQEGEDDVILANNRYLGMLTGLLRDWYPVSFTLPTAVLDEIWRDQKLRVFMDINQMVLGGFRVTLKNSTLAVKYFVSGDVTPTAVPVYRFWSPVISSHFYTMNETERDKLINEYAKAWIYEGTAYRALTDAGKTGARPVHRFWSPKAGGHFFTISEAEKDKILTNYANAVWTYEGIAFYAYADGEQPAGAQPVYRFWSPRVSHHFYTISEAEKEKILTQYSSDIWTYEGIAWYAYVE